MTKFVELVEQYPQNEDIRFAKATDPFRAIGIRRVDGKPFLYIFEDGEPQRMLNRAEITALMLDIDDDWRVSNQ